MISFWCLVPKGEKLGPKQMDQLPLVNFENNRVRTFDLSKYSKCLFLSKVGLLWGECLIMGKRGMLGSCFGEPKVSHEEAASAEVVSKRWPKVPFHGASAF